MGSEEHKEMLFWTKEEYKKFSFEMMDKPVSFYAFEMLYWCGIREGELLALTAADFDFEKETVRINKSYQRLHGEDVITTPKTKKSNRMIKIPKFLCEEMQEYLNLLYELKKKDRIFTVTKSYLHHEMDRGAEAAGVKRIRIYDLRHSHISLLIDMGFSAVAIADRVGDVYKRQLCLWHSVVSGGLYPDHRSHQPGSSAVDVRAPFCTAGPGKDGSGPFAGAPGAPGDGGTAELSVRFCAGQSSKCLRKTGDLW